MVRKWTSSLFVVALLGGILLSNSSGRARFGAGNTGAPGESTTCAGCHGGGNYNPSIALNLIDPDNGQSTESYTPGKTYRVSLEISASNNPQGYGFQAVALKSSDNSRINNWVQALTDGTNFQTANGGRQYFEQSRTLNTNTFLAEWRAPEENTGDITFYFVGNAVNRNGNSGGDAVVTNSATFSEANLTSSRNRESQAVALRAYPNPTMGALQLEGSDLQGGVLQLRLINLQGQVLREERLQTSGTFSQTWDLSDLPSGMYWLEGVQGGLRSTQKVLLSR